jgi:hypothetical protein
MPAPKAFGPVSKPLNRGRIWPENDGFDRQNCDGLEEMFNFETALVRLRS